MELDEGPHPVRRAVIGLLLGGLVGVTYVVLARRPEAPRAGSG